MLLVDTAIDSGRLRCARDWNAKHQALERLLDKGGIIRHVHKTATDDLIRQLRKLG